MGYNIQLNSVNTSMNKLFPLTVISLLLLSASCMRSDGDYKLPGVYRISIMQGNVIEQDMLDRLKPGMEKHQVKFIMGTPTIIDPFHPDRWDYIYTFTYGANQRNQRHLALYFENGKLAYLDGDVKTSLRKPPESLKRSKIVEVPLRERKPPGVLDSVLNKLPFVGKDDSAVPKPETTTADTPDPVEAENKVAQPADDSEPAASSDSTTTEKEKPKEKGFFGKLLDKLPFVGDNEDKDSSADSQK